MSEPWVPEIAIAEAHRRRQKRRRMWRSLAAAFATAVLLLLGLFFYRRHQSERALEDAIAETDRLDPGWRLEDLLKRQSALPAEQNAALHITAAHAILANWKLDAKDAIHQRLLPQFQLDEKLVDCAPQKPSAISCGQGGSCESDTAQDGLVSPESELVF